MAVYGPRGDNNAQTVAIQAGCAFLIKKVLPDRKERFASEYVLIGVQITFESILRDHLGVFLMAGQTEVTDDSDPIYDVQIR